MQPVARIEARRKSGVTRDARNSDPDFALMSLVKRRRCDIPASPRFPREVFDAMIVQRWGRSLETSVIKL
jgi:hypothetical protein